MTNKRIKLIVAVLSILSVQSSAQSITYNLILFDSCTSEYSNALLYYLEKGELSYSVSDTIGTIKLDSIGHHTLKSDLRNSNKEIFIDRGANFDTLATWTIRECLEPISHPNFIGYCCCDEKCNGYQQDFYQNGALRIEGQFKNGLGRGEIKFYNLDGSIRLVRKYDRKGNLKWEKEFQEK